MRILVVTAVPAERDAVSPGGDCAAHVEVHSVGAGPAAAAAGTARLLTLARAAGKPFALVVNAGVAGGFDGVAPIGSVVVATAAVAADLGADSPSGFLPIADLGFGGKGVVTVPSLLTSTATDAIRPTGTPVATGPVLTVSTVTGTAERAAALAARHPGAAAEGMEGFGVATAAQADGVPFLELRTISNVVGPRDRDAWRIGDALRALTASTAAALPALTASLREGPS